MAVIRDTNKEFFLLDSL